MNRRSALLAASLTVSAAFWGCREGTEATGDTESTTVEEVSREAGEALGAAAEYFQERREKFITGAREEPAGWNKDSKTCETMEWTPPDGTGRGFRNSGSKSVESSREPRRNWPI